MKIDPRLYARIMAISYESRSVLEQNTLFPGGGTHNLDFFFVLMRRCPEFREFRALGFRCPCQQVTRISRAPSLAST